MGAKTGTYPNELIEVTSLDNDDTILIVRGNNIFTARASVLATGGITVENVLTSDSETNALSAAQGKALNTALSSKAALVSPAFTGNPTAPTVAVATDNNEIATTAFVHDITDTIITSLGDKCPLVNGKVPSANLPSYVDDALEFANLSAFPVTGESGKIYYLAVDTNLIYRWTGSTYILIGSNTFTNIAEWILTPTINTQFDGDYTLQTVDNDGATYLRMDYPTANEVLIPISQTRTITIRQSGVGITTLVADTGVTLNGNPVFSGAGDTKTLVPIYVDEFESDWDIIGASA